MSGLTGIIPWIQIITSLMIIPSILIQQRGAGIGGALGGGESVMYSVRRGPEKFFFIVTIIASIILAASAVLELLILS